MSDAAPSPLQILVLDRIVEDKNMARYYVVAIELRLLGDSLVREWGRPGRSYKRLIELYEGESRVTVALSEWLARKLTLLL
jgi:predicted DNA-binding WGR domain protein